MRVRLRSRTGNGGADVSTAEASALSETVDSDAVFLEAPDEVQLDATVADEGGAAASEARPLRRRTGIGFWLAVGWLGVLVFLAVFASWLPFVKDPDSPDFLALRAGPSADHWLGTDDIGRDVFARVVFGARVSLIVGVTTIGIGLLVGGFLGVIAGYYRGRLEQIIVAAMDVMLAFPSLVLLLAIVSFLGQNSLKNVILGLSILAVPSLARITRATTLTFAQREFVLAARTLGAGNRRIIMREVLPNAIPPMLSYALLSIAIVIVAEGTLSFLGLSVKAPNPTWGNMINEGRAALPLAPHISLFPAGVMFLTLLAINFVGDSLRGRFDIREARI